MLWQQHGIAGQQGLFPTAVTQYRESMNMVADWAKQRGLMDHTGNECVPLRASVLDALMNNPPRVAVLQRGDGYADVIDLEASASQSGRAREEPSTADFEALLSEVPMLQMLSADDLRALSLVAAAAAGDARGTHRDPGHRGRLVVRRSPTEWWR